MRTEHISPRPLAMMLGASRLRAFEAHARRDEFQNQRRSTDDASIDSTRCWETHKGLALIDCST